MNYKIYTIDEIKKRFEKVAKKYEIEGAYLFGSYARGDATLEHIIEYCEEIPQIHKDFGDTYETFKMNKHYFKSVAIQ